MQKIDFPQEMEESTKGLIFALSYRFAKRKPGLEQNDLICEALQKFFEVKATYDPSRETALNSVFYRSMFNHFMNLQNKFNIAPSKELSDHNTAHAAQLGILQNIDTYLDTLKKLITEETAKDVLDTLLTKAAYKKNIKDICAELGISFFRYQQAEYKIRSAIKRLTSDMAV